MIDSSEISYNGTHCACHAIPLDFPKLKSQDLIPKPSCAKKSIRTLLFLTDPYKDP